MGSPGPATISLTAAGSAWGVRRCAGYLAGIITGSAAVLAAVAAGITATLLAVPGMRVALIVASAAYILWLAYHIATPPGHSTIHGGQPAFPGRGNAAGDRQPEGVVCDLRGIR